MFVTDDMVWAMIEKYGEPVRESFRIPLSDQEHAYIRSTQRRGRRHDVTLYIFKDDQLIVTAKHPYPPGLYRPPSGGCDPGEPIEDGAKREAHEETGCEIEIERFLMITNVEFYKRTDPDDIIDWNSFVLKARYVSGDFNFTDTHEIREVRLASLDDFDEFERLAYDTGKGGLNYRAQLHRAVERVL